MRRADLPKFAGFFFFVLLFSAVVFAQPESAPPAKNPAATDEETPAVVRHLPDYETIRSRAASIKNRDDLRRIFGAEPVLDSTNFAGGTEAAAADYDAGRLLIVEYTTPQFSVDADAAARQYLTENAPEAPIYFRRVGNYEVFVFGASDEAAANALIDQVKYEKTVQWLGSDPFALQRAQRAYLQRTSDVFIWTFISIVLGLGCAVLVGIFAGLMIFYIRRQKRATMHTFSDAGGMIRLNLDELTSDILPDRLLKD